MSILFESIEDIPEGLNNLMRRIEKMTKELEKNKNSENIIKLQQIIENTASNLYFINSELASLNKLMVAAGKRSKKEDH